MVPWKTTSPTNSGLSTSMLVSQSVYLVPASESAKSKCSMCCPFLLLWWRPLLLGWRPSLLGLYSGVPVLFQVATAQQWGPDFSSLDLRTSVHRSFHFHQFCRGGVLPCPVIAVNNDICFRENLEETMFHPQNPWDSSSMFLEAKSETGRNTRTFPPGWTATEPMGVMGSFFCRKSATPLGVWVFNP